MAAERESPGMACPLPKKAEPQKSGQADVVQNRGRAGLQQSDDGSGDRNLVGIGEIIERITTISIVANAKAITIPGPFHEDAVGFTPPGMADFVAERADLRALELKAFRSAPNVKKSFAHKSLRYSLLTFSEGVARHRPIKAAAFLIGVRYRLATLS